MLHTVHSMDLETVLGSLMVIYIYNYQAVISLFCQLFYLLQTSVEILAVIMFNTLHKWPL